MSACWTWGSVRFFPSRGLVASQHLLHGLKERDDNLQVALVCQRIQPRARSSILNVAADVGVIFIVGQLNWRLLSKAARKEGFDDISDGQMHDGKYEVS